jgi:hypothetical protein
MSGERKLDKGNDRKVTDKKKKIQGVDVITALLQVLHTAVNRLICIRFVWELIVWSPRFMPRQRSLRPVSSLGFSLPTNGGALC